MKAWVARAGKYGEREEFALENNVVVIGWQEIGDLSGTKDRDDVRTAVDAALSNPKLAANHTGQLFAFVHTMEPGDLIVLPCKTTSTIAIGKITGDYHYVATNPPDARHTRPVKWMRVDIPRSSVGQDLLYSLGSALTVFSVERNSAVARIGGLADTGKDPGAAAQIGLTPSGVDEATSTDTDGEPTEGSAPVDIELIAADRIVAYISERFAGHRLAELIEAILQAEGYTTRFSPPGPDGGIDVLAGSGPLASTHPVSPCR